MTLDRKELAEKLIDNLNKLHGATSSGVDKTEQNELFKEFFDLLNEMSLDLLPYAAASQFIYSNESDKEGLYFIQSIEERIKTNFNYEDEIYKKGLKIVEHLELAQQQKEALFAKQEKKIFDIEQKTKKMKNVEKKARDLHKETERLRIQNNTMTSNFITILGIFAAILMGAFGSIQGFTSIFDNAHKLDIADILIISSIGASAVILILFFLLNGIAKLTKKDLSSDLNEKAYIIERHPTLVISHLILTVVALTGAALKLRNTNIQLSLQDDVWWLIPIAWLIYSYFVVKKKRIIPYEFRKKNK